MSDQKRTPRQGPALSGKSPRPSPANGSSAAGGSVSKGSGAKPPAPKTAPPVRNNPATRSIPVIKPQQPASNGRPGPGTPADQVSGPAKPAKPVKPVKPSNAGKAGRRPSGAKRPAAAKPAAKQSAVPKGLLGAKGGAKRPAVRPGPGAKQASGPSDEPASSKNNAGSLPEPEAAAPLPDLSAHTDSPAWLSTDGSHDAELWDEAFDAEAREAAPAEPSVVPAEDVHLQEPSLDTPTISSDAAEAASLPETAAEVRAVSEEVAEAGKQAGISEPAPEGTEVAVEPGAGLTELEPTSVLDESADQPEDGSGDGPKPEPKEDADSPEEAAASAGKEPAPEAGAEPAAKPEPKTKSGKAPSDKVPSGKEKEDASVPGKAEVEPGKADEAPGDPEEKPGEAANSEEPAGDAKARKPENGPEAKPGTPVIQTSTVPSGSTDVAAPVTDSFESLTLTKKDPVDTGLTHTVNPSGSSAVPADSRRARRTREAEEAAARGKGPGKTTRALVLLGSILIVVLLGIWLATIIADSNREEGVLEDSVSPVDLEAGACLQDFQSVNSEVTVVTCETPHNAQLVATSSYADSDTFPGTGALAAKAEEVCSSVIYTDAASKYSDLELNRAVPTQRSWDAGDRRVDCFVVAPGEDLTESLIVQP